MPPDAARPKPVVLVIMDGWGLSPANRGNAITLANTPTIDGLSREYPHISLKASGEAVGLPRGEDGNTETGHLNIGAGQIVYQDLLRINKSVASGDFFSNPKFLSAIDHAKKHSSTLHLLGLVGSGGVHSNLDHLYALLNVCKQQNFTNVAIQVITDGRDSPPTSAVTFIQQIQNRLNELGFGHIGSIMGRYYAMDRDHRWERTQVAYEALTQGKAATATDPKQALLDSYEKGVTDEFIQPVIITDKSSQPKSLVKENDALIFYNYRIDRPRQLTKAFTFPNFAYVAVKKEGFDPYAIKYYKSHLAQAPTKDRQPFNRGDLVKNLYFVTMTEYETGLPVHTAFPPQTIEEPVGKVVADIGLRQLRMSETEKERFVTFYFNGQREDPFPGEDRIIIPSPPVATYDQKPEMSSIELTDTLLERIETELYDFVVINFANPDMVGHTGNLEAGIKTCEITDQNIKRIIDATYKKGGVVLITADHGNVEEMINLETGDIDTEHSINPVPFIICSEHLKNQEPKRQTGILADIAPTILKLMNIDKPENMTGQSLI